MSVNPLFKDATSADSSMQDEWSIFPAESEVRSSIVAPISDQRPASVETDTHPGQCRYCTETIPPGARQCPLCLRDVAPSRADARKAPAHASPFPPYRAPVGKASAGAPTQGAEAGDANVATGAVYTLESPAVCPECDAEIGAIHVIRVLRTQVSFTSTLPRRAYVITCPSCRRLLSGGLSGLL
jgi:hypothetical protein